MLLMGMVDYQYRLNPNRLKYAKKLKEETRPAVEKLYRSNESLSLTVLAQELPPHCRGQERGILRAEVVAGDHNVNSAVGGF